MKLSITAVKNGKAKAADMPVGTVIGHGELNGKPMWCLVLEPGSCGVNVVELHSGILRNIHALSEVIPVRTAELRIEY